MLPDACAVLDSLGGDSFGPETVTVQARSGEPVIEVRGVLLDSRYDPRRDAVRRFERLLPDLEGREAVVLLGDGCAYLAELVAEETGLEVIVLEAASTIPQTARRLRGDDAFRRFSLLFTRDLVTPEDISRLLPPPEKTLFVPHVASGRLFDGEYGRVGKLVTVALKRSAANLGTVSWFGRRWLVNILENLKAEGRSTLGAVSTGDILIAVPGPTLPDALRTAGPRNRYYLIALAPVLPWLEHAGIRPDLVVTSDGGYANLLHFCGQKSEGIPLVYPLMTHAGIPRIWAGPRIPVSMGTTLENSLTTQGVPVFPESPTVAAFALHLAYSLGAKRIFLAGQDFGQPGWRGHMPGYRFEEALFCRSTRIATPCGTLSRPFREHWQEEDGFRFSETFRLYRDGFMDLVRAMKVPVHALESGPLVRTIRAGGIRPECAAEVQVIPASDDLLEREGVSAFRDAISRLISDFPSDPAVILEDHHLAGVVELLRPGALHLFRERGEMPEAEQFFDGLKDLFLLAERHFSGLL